MALSFTVTVTLDAGFNHEEEISLGPAGEPSGNHEM